MRILKKGVFRMIELFILIGLFGIVGIILFLTGLSPGMKAANKHAKTINKDIF